MRQAEFVSKMNHGDACLEYETVTGVHIPKRTIHGFVRKIAPMLLSASRTAAKAGLVLKDSTKVRSRASGVMNQVRILVSGGGRLLSLGVTDLWPRVEVSMLVSDGEPELVNTWKPGASGSAFSTH